MRFNRALNGFACLVAIAACALASRAADLIGRERVDIGWHDEFQANAGWALEHTRATEEHPAAQMAFGADGLSIEMPASGNVVLARTTNPIWVQAFPFLEVRYELRRGGGSPAAVSLFMSDDSTGPITPDALNPENPLAGEHEAIVGPLPADSTQAVFDLRKLFPSDRIARLEFRVRADGPATARLTRLAFRACDPRSPASQGTPLADGPTLADFRPAGGDSTWQPIPLPGEPAIPATQLAWAMSEAREWPAGRVVGCDGIPFTMGSADRAALASAVMEQESLAVAGSWQGSELALLLATRLFGNDGPWHSPASVKGRGAITSPHRLAVRLSYEDGSTCTSFPWSVRRKGWSVESAAQAYVVPLDSAKRLVRFAVVEQMNYGQVFLLATSINTSATPIFPEARPDRTLPPLSSVRTPRPSSPNWECTDDRLTIENDWLRLVARPSHGLAIERLILAPLDREIIASSQPAPLIELVGEDGKAVAVALEVVGSRGTGSVADLTLLGEVDAGRTLSVRLAVDGGGAVRLCPTLTNAGDQPWKVGVRYGQLRGCRIAPEPSDRRYLLGTRNALLSGEPIAVTKEYGGPWPLPLVDLFAEQAGAGLGLFVPDLELLPKRLEFRQHQGGADLAVRLGDVVVPPGGKRALPIVVLVPHAGDWHDLFESYRRWLREAMPQRSKQLTDAFYCRRDYPLGGTGYLFDPVSLRYTPERLIEEGQAFGGIQMIDISGWAFNRATGRVGDYLTNDLGGLDELRRMAEGTHAAGLKLGLYFEGFLIDKRSKLAGRALPAWQRIDRAGKPAWWSGEMEFFACPGVEAWRNELAGMITTVARHTGADAVYVDEFGLLGSATECWSPEHGHPVPSNPIQDQRAMLRAIRDGLDRESLKTAIYLEFTPPDALMGLVDAAFDYGLSDIVPGRHPASLPLYRYAFPQLASYEMVSQGIRPVPAEVDDLHRCIFHGLGLWLKGRADSWYSPQFRELAKAARRVFEDHAEVLHAEACEPLIPTLQPDLYANRFTGRDRTIVTLYNAGYTTVSGPLIDVLLPEGWTATELLTSEAAKCTPEGDRVTIHGRVELHSTSVLLLIRPGASSQER